MKIATISKELLSHVTICVTNNGWRKLQITVGNQNKATENPNLK